MKSIIAVLAAALLVGCATVGSNYDSNKVSQIIEGKTTKAEVIRLLGEPTMTGNSTGGLSGDGQFSSYAVFSYGRSTARPETFIPVVGVLVGGADSETKSLTVFFDENDVVTSTTSSEMKSSVNTGLLN